MLLHRLEQRRLHLGRGAVDLVGQDDLGEERPLLDVELLRLLVEHHRPDDVGRQEVGRELDAGERGVDDLRQRAHRQGLGEAGDALEQDVAAGQQADEEPLDHGVLPHDPAGHFLEDALHGQLGRLVGQLRRAHAGWLLMVE